MIREPEDLPFPTKSKPAATGGGGCHRPRGFVWGDQANWVQSLRSARNGGFFMVRPGWLPGTRGEADASRHIGLDAWKWREIRPLPRSREGNESPHKPLPRTARWEGGPVGRPKPEDPSSPATSREEIDEEVAGYIGRAGPVGSHGRSCLGRGRHLRGGRQGQGGPSRRDGGHRHHDRGRYQQGPLHHLCGDRPANQGKGPVEPDGRPARRARRLYPQQRPLRRGYQPDHAGHPGRADHAHARRGAPG